MTIFGTGNLTRSTIGHNGTTLDLSMNYVYGTVLAISFPISLLLNPVVFYYNYKQKLSLVSGLFLLLSGMDFLFSFRSMNTAYNLLKPELEPLYDPDPSVYQRFQALLGYTVGYTSMFTTLMMCIVRYIKIKAPFWALSNKSLVASVVITSIAVDVLYSCAAGVITSCVYSDAWFSVMQGMISTERTESTNEIATYLTIMVPFYIKIGFSVLFSLLTVIHLRSESGQAIPEIKRKSVVMIVLLNLGNVVWFVTCVLSNIVTEQLDFEWDFDSDDHWTYEFFYLTFFDSVVAQCVLAAYNPLIFCTRTNGIRAMIRNFFRTGTMDVDSVYKAGTSEAGNSVNTGSFYRGTAGSLRPILREEE